MLITLTPSSAPGLSEIVVGDSLCAIGRHEPPFNTYPLELTEKLSRRHARLFEQDGAVYLVDVGSLNGTTVDGLRIGREPVLLKDGDEIAFAGLGFRVGIRQVAATGADAGEPELTLRPDHPELGLEPIVVTEFPFLINKASDVFARYKDQLPADLSYISRRHAHFFLRAQQLYIEDLGSTNGTYVNGQRLEEHAQVLHNGDRVAFGGEKFSYGIELTVHEKIDMTATEALVPVDNDFTKTTFVTAANSFLDIFCYENEAAKADAVAPAPPIDERPRAALTAFANTRWQRSLQRARHSLGEIRAALYEGGTPALSPSRRRWLFGVIAAVVVIAAGLVYFQSASERAIKNLIDEHAYADASARAANYLRKHPHDPEIEPLATEALLKDVVPAWMAQITANDFAAAAQTLQERQPRVQFHPEGAALLGLLQWATALEKFIAERGGADAPVVMFAQEKSIRSLLDTWESGAVEQRHRFESIAHQVPEFAPLRAQIFSHLRTLNSLKTLDLVAIERLEKSIDAALASDDPGSLTAVFNEFATRYPRIHGVDALQNDLQKYLALDTARRQQQWIEAYQLAHDNAFTTPPFRERVRALQQSQLPNTEFVAQYQRAQDAWRQGQFDTAIAALEGIEKTPWGAVARTELERERQLQRDFTALQAAKNGADHEDRWLAFYGALDPVKDRYLLDQLAGEVQQHSASVLVKAERFYETARASWDKYRNSGGIRGLQRLEPSISSEFRQAAQALTGAYENISSGAKVYKLLNKPLPEEWSALQTQIVGEVVLQRRSLEELTMVLKPALSKAKLDLLPVPAEPAAAANVVAEPAMAGTPSVRSQ